MGNSASNPSLEYVGQDSKIRFYHVPKSGGTTIFNMTQGWSNFKRAHPRDNHVKVQDFPPTEDEIGLTVLRHPYTRFESAFFHMVDACNENFYYRFANVSDCDQLQSNGIDFNVFQNDPNEFLEAIKNTNHPYHHEAKLVFDTFVIFRPQFYWLNDGSLLHKRIKIYLRQENLKKEFEQLAKKLGHLPKWPNDYESNKRITKSSKPLTDRSKMILQELYDDDFQHFAFER